MPATPPATSAGASTAAEASAAPASRRPVLAALFHGFTLALLLAAALCLGLELRGWWQDGLWRTLTLGELWYRLDPAGLNLFQAIVQRYIAPDLWDRVIVALLLRPAWLVFGLPALSVLLLGRLRRLWRRRA